ncbi:heavy metal-associated isoprenylated plant protein 46 [Quercus suber]|uniref:heavy metal-associated isoprenylated plant protein 46 n=1 Tax=Quercus suber TaxID=58331 RepID=UPI000CE1B58A|nr:heavy metal-associated isoprenylated plant protein 46-like [Quercus suber]XP_023891329.1 heavy metal-associated isoprenylated plant protein 46-like [Quercus suber]
MTQTVLIQVSMDGQRNFFRITEGEKARNKAMKIAVGLSGVESLTLKGQNRDQIEVKGDIDAVKLVTLLRKKVGHASIVSVAEDKKEEKEEEKKDEKKDEPKIKWPHGSPYVFYEIIDPCYDTNVCSIM